MSFSETLKNNTELQQSVIRLVIGTIFLAYFCVHMLVAPESQTTNILVVASFIGISILVTVSILHNGQVIPGRRVFTIFLDTTYASIPLLLNTTMAAPLVVMYFWIPLGNGFRFGVRYLYIATALSFMGFTTVLVLNPHWQHLLPIGLSLLLAIILVPAYSASLMQKLHDCIQSEKEANQAKSQFLANMSHELRTPLNGVIGVSDLLGMTQLDSRQTEFVKTIRSSADTLLELIENVLDISRIEAGRLLISKSDFALDPFIANIISIMEPLADKKGILLQSHIHEGTPRFLRGDTAHLKQVLVNLLGNAIKFTDSGRVELSIRLIGDDSTLRLQFKVIDTGIGIPEKAQATIFSSFTQADPSITRRYGGSGLGTTIAKQIVELMGGNIGFTSTEGVGSTFYFDIPLETAMAEPQQPPGETSQGGKIISNVVSFPGSAKTKPKPLTILVADDNSVNLTVTSGLLEFAGHRVITAIDGEDALAKLENHESELDLAILDMQMPHLSGIETIQRWRFMEVGHLPIIILTADAREQTALLCRESGADAFVTKPIRSHDLIKTVEACARAAPERSASVLQVVPQLLPKPVDESILDDLFQMGGGVEFVRLLIDEFTAESRRTLVLVEKALEEQDRLACKDHLHTLKGGARDIGAGHLAALCASAEISLLNHMGGLVEAKALVVQISRELERVEPALNSYISHKAKAN